MNLNWKETAFLAIMIPLTGVVMWIFGAQTLSETPAQKPAEEAEKPAAIDFPLITFIDASKGPEDARVTIVEYGDHACPFCRKAEKDIERLLAAHSDVRFVWKDLPSELHVGSTIASEAAQCAKDQGRFWEYHERLFEQEAFFTQTSLALLANTIGLDLDRFSQCLSQRKKRYVIERNISEAEALGIDGTPYFFIGEKRYSGLLSFEDLENAIK